MAICGHELIQIMEDGQNVCIDCDQSVDPDLTPCTHANFVRSRSGVLLCAWCGEAAV